MGFLTNFSGSVLDGETCELLEYRHLIKSPKYKDDWGFSFGKKLGRLAQGMPRHNNGTNNLFFINKDEVPANRYKDITYGKIVCNVRPQKDEVNRTSLLIRHWFYSMSLDKSSNQMLKTEEY